MKQKRRSAAVVVAEGQGIVGICTERDIVQKLVAAGLDSTATTVGSIMSANPQVIYEGKPFGHALHLMFEGGFRHLPVVDESKNPVGIVSVRDSLGLEVIRFSEEVSYRETIAEIL
jgi:CBS domain-containing protein